jgi:Glutaredoxin-like domain (DUF836)
MTSYILYKTNFCHLCDEAEIIIRKVHPSIEVQMIEIIDDDSLIELYGSKIPVLKNTVTSEELNWPFTSEDLNKFIFK